MWLLGRKGPPLQGSCLWSVEEAFELRPEWGRGSSGELKAGGGADGAAGALGAEALRPSLLACKGGRTKAGASGRLRGQRQGQRPGSLAVEGGTALYQVSGRPAGCHILKGQRRTRAKRAGGFGRLLHWPWREQMVTPTWLPVVGLPGINQVHQVDLLPMQGDPCVGKIPWMRAQQATHSSILAWKIPIDREAWQSTGLQSRTQLMLA